MAAAGVSALFAVVILAQTPASVTLNRPTPTAPHAYFDALAARSEKFSAYSLRSQTQLNGLTKSSTSDFFTYAPAADTHPLKQDAAKLFKPPRSTYSQYPQFATWGNVGDDNVPGNKALRFPIGITSGQFLMTWDVWWGEEFQTNAGWADNPVNAWKTFFLFAGLGTGGTDSMWVGHDHTGNARSTPGAISKHHDGPTGGSAVAPGTLSRDPRNPTGRGAVPMRSFTTYANRWTRYWVEIKMAVPGAQFTDWSEIAAGGVPLTGTWDMLSVWIGDEQRNAQRVLYRVPIARDAVKDPMYASLRFAWDTSTNNINGGGLTGPVVAYMRNLVILRNVPVDDSGSEFTSGPRPRPPTNVRIVP